MNAAQTPFIEICLHHWWKRPWAHQMTDEPARAFEPRPGLRYQVDFELSEHFSVLSDAQMECVLDQIRQGRRVQAQLLLHVTEAQLPDTLAILASGQINCRAQLGVIALASYTQRFHFGNPLTATAAAGWAIEQGFEALDLVSAVAAHHGLEGGPPRHAQESTLQNTVTPCLDWVFRVNPHCQNSQEDIQ